MNYLIKVLFETDKAVYRDLIVSSKHSLLDCHNAILDAFNFKGEEMASFYETDEDQEVLEEFPLIAIDPAYSGKLMKDVKLEELIQAEGDNFQYVYDYLSDFRFYIECITVIEATGKLSDIKLKKSVGPAPQETDNAVDGKDAEKILMDAILGDEFDEDEEDEFLDSDSFDSIDDYEEYI